MGYEYNNIVSIIFVFVLFFYVLDLTCWTIRTQLNDSNSTRTEFNYRSKKKNCN